MAFIRELRDIFNSKDNVLMKIIVINVLVFIVVNIFVALSGVVGIHESVYARWFALPANFNEFIFHPWTIITYMFLHAELSHVFFNLLWLHWVGKIFVEYYGSKRLLGIYLLGGISGAILFLLTCNLIPGVSSNQYLLGASAGVTAIVIAIAVLIPDYIVNLLFFGPVKLKYIALVSFILTSIIDLTQNTGGKVAHIGGAFFGLIYGMQYRKGKDIAKWFMNLLDNIFSFSLFSRKAHFKVVYNRGMSDEDYNMNKVERQRRIDGILDKISKSGYESLSKEERDLLFKMGNKK